MVNKENYINHFTEGQSFKKEIPSNDLVNKIKEIPFNYNRKNNTHMNWIALLAVASFIGFMLINFLHLNQTNQENNPFEAHLSNYNYYSL